MYRKLHYNRLVNYVLLILAFYACYLIRTQLRLAGVTPWTASENTKQTKPRDASIVQAIEKLVIESKDVCLEHVDVVPMCEPVRKVVFTKTHKTGSTTLASIIERYGYTRNLSFVVPPDRKNGPHILSMNHLFHRNMAKKSAPPLNGGEYYDMLTNHVRYNRPEMDAVLPNATHITIIRHPAKHFESSFSYFLWGRDVKKEHGDVNVGDQIATFMETPEKYIKNKIYFWWQAHNGQLFDLGLSTDDTDNHTTVSKKIQALEKEMEFILIADHFDESLLILKKKFCWTMDDILYIPNGVRSKQFRREMSEETRARILDWNDSDLKLFEYFNKTLWQNIAEYGPCFERDLQYFREKRQKVMDECIGPSQVVKKDPRETRYVLKENASELCLNMWRGDVTFTKFIRNKQLSRIVHPLNN
ncbi:galactosylceramide sulfotransferase-like [Saccoglossus kowalevskii]|uniref:Galactosylceramide sulfotransferase-like n=1 Tax=Saccoglossus kowalevskii TaxID=10224 RepID=A0ABM0M908_SACKO|nr:PREDICTED: galactosylceramide sulfotransferase-like [Saccoglossus kowalevskii]